MKYSALAAVLFLYGLLATPQVSAHDDYANELIARAVSMGLADHPYWHRLLYYIPTGSGTRWRSDATTPEFFASPDGRTDPAAELSATLRVLFDPPLAPDIGQQTEQHPQCAFIARYHWLREQLEIDDARLPPQPCERFQGWFDAIDPAQVALVFAADYVGNPSSAFGHTLLRLDRPSRDASRLVSYAVNFAAIVGDANAITYAWRGLTGGYPGYFSLLPYYDKVKEYNDLESRDMWEYEIDLTPGEIERLMRHLWEVGSVAFDYYFLRENCSYRLLGLLEVARPGLQLTAEFPWWAIPTDTVRAVLAQESLLRSVTYRPSAERRLKHGIALASAPVRRAAILYADGEEPALLQAAQRVHAIELAHDYLHYQYLDGKLSRDVVAPRLHGLLILRSREEGGMPVPDPPVPATRPDEGHPTARFGIGAGYTHGVRFTELQLRAAYHDLADPAPGYRHGTQIDFLGGTLRFDHEQERWQVERLDVVEIWSLAPRNRFLRPVSWKVGGGLVRDHLLTEDGALTGVFHGGAGLGYALDARERVLVYGLLDGQLAASRHLEDGLRLGVGPRFGLVFAGMRSALHATMAARDYHDDSGTRQELRIEQSLSLSPAFALRLRVDYLRQDGRYHRERALTAHWYF